MIGSNLTTGLIEKMSKRMGVTGHGLAYQMEDGRVVIDSENGGNEKEFAGLTDLNGDYFYIRRLDEYVNEKAVKRGGGSCGSVQQVSERLRIVGVYTCVNAESLCNKLKACLIDAGNQTKDPNVIGGLQIEFKKSTTNFETIFKEETKKNDVVWNTTLKMCLIDFVLSYRYDYCSVQSENLEIC